MTTSGSGSGVDLLMNHHPISVRMKDNNNTYYYHHHYRRLKKLAWNLDEEIDRTRFRGPCLGSDGVEALPRTLITHLIIIITHLTTEGRGES